MSASDIRKQQGRRDTAYIIHPDFSRLRAADDRNSRDTEDALSEAEGLARAIDLDIAHTRTVKISKIQPGAFLGKGTRETIRQDIEEYEPDIVIFNHTLSPVQQRNLEREWKAKVIDRTGLILEIFGARARTKEGRLQVELAALEYQKSRLVRSWTHLERQRGGAGFMGGPGETQIELDRRLIGERITKLKKDLQDVRRTRELARKSRERVPFPVISLVGYTNAGKSTLFNTLTDAGVFAEDLPFATLDPTMRALTLPDGKKAILSDTVGFIADLPTHLVEAFRATLEQIAHADVIVHVIDASRPDYAAQKRDVAGVLKNLGIPYEEDDRIIELYNKIDVLPEEEGQELRRMRKTAKPPAVAVSALKEQGIEQFLELAGKILSRDEKTMRFYIRHNDGKALAWLYEHGHVRERQDTDKGIVLYADLDAGTLGKFVSRYGYKPQP